MSLVPAVEHIWLFGYGSLTWKASYPYVMRRVCFLGTYNTTVLSRALLATKQARRRRAHDLTRVHSRSARLFLHPCLPAHMRRRRNLTALSASPPG
jgi:hypothetical protein